VIRTSTICQLQEDMQFCFESHPKMHDDFLGAHDFSEN
jgi:hypothetical protein